VSEKTCMTILGHKTRSMFDRYNISSEKDLSEAMDLLQKFHSQQPRTVTAIAAQS
jgi:hypothetical protein